MVLKLQMREKKFQASVSFNGVWWTIPENSPSIVEAVFFSLSIQSWYKQIIFLVPYIIRVHRNCTIKNLSHMIWCNVIFQFIHYRGKLTCPSRLKIIPPKFIQYLSWSPIVTRRSYHSGSSVLEGLESVTHPFPTAPPHYTTIIEIRS